MLLIGLTGGIGSGKSTVAARLAEHGAVVLDADRVAREVVQPGTPGLEQVRRRFGEQVVGADGALDRVALGRTVFGDAQARADLEAITHPLIRARTQQRLGELPSAAVVVHDVPLLVELGYAPRYHLVLVVGAAESVRTERLVSARGMSRSDALARVRAQSDDAARRAVADAWLDNDGTPQHVLDQVDRLWHDRLAPLHANLERARPAGPDELVAATPGEDVAGRGARVLARLRWLLGDEVPGRHTAAGAGAPPGWTEVTLWLDRPGDHAVADRLGDGGFAPVGSHRHGSCDPGRPGSVTLRTPVAPMPSGG